ncbi:hypothetical protein SAMN04488541_102123 [Thermoflexibacter ruber]|uniref:Uncharacterized protein n=1 Tax=Thermoflexibacter ruber TaxID=1003 RepID=A0A1I2H1M3_9BACT|nr:hypothetical protein SAMN04488541_102123 [Thermoflexibacter ruber]
MYFLFLNRSCFKGMIRSNMDCGNSGFNFELLAK